MEWAVHCGMRREEGSFKEHLSMDLKDNDYDDIFHLFSVGSAGAVLNVNWREKSREPFQDEKKVKTQKFYRYFDKGCLEPFAGKRFPKTFLARNDHRSLHFGSLLGEHFTTVISLKFQTFSERFHSFGIHISRGRDRRRRR